MERERIWKVNAIYLLAAVLVPAALVVITARQYWRLPEGWEPGLLLQLPPELPVQWPPEKAVLLPIVVLILCFLWWEFGVRGIYRVCLDGLERDLEKKGFRQDWSFTGRGCAVMLDEDAGRVALLFEWSPFRPYVFSAERIDRVWVEDGQRGNGVMRGSKRVSFLFTVGRSKVRVNTFSSNRRWKMDSDHILYAISTADMMADAIEEARKGAVMDGAA